MDKKILPNLGTAKLTKYRVKNMLDFYAIKAMFGNYIFSQKSKDGNYYILADKEQFGHLNKSGYQITEVPYTL